MSATALSFSPEQMVKSIPAVRIVSIAPVEFTARMQVTKGFRDYTLPAAERGKWTFIDVPAEMLHLADFHDDRRVNDKPVYEDPSQRAQKLASMWAYPGFGPKLVGRYGVAALPPGETEPSAELLAQLTREQEVLANSLVTDATDKLESGNATSITDKTHRAMAKWVMGNGAESLPWFGRRDFSNTKKCPKCTGQINVAATGCQLCNADLIEWHQKYDPEAADDPVVAAILARLEKAKQAKAMAASIPPPPAPPSPVRPLVAQQGSK